MKFVDLGQLDGPVLLFGGPYSNLAATSALFAEASKRHIPADQIICTGDTVAYCADAAATVSEIRKTKCVVIAGNCEKQLADGALDCGCGFGTGTTCDLLSKGWYAHANAQIGVDARAWMGDLPDIVCFTHHSKRYAVIHGGVTDISRFLWSTSGEAGFLEEISLLRNLVGPMDAVVAGHSGIGFSRHIHGVEWTNAGVIGMPPNNGSSETQFVVLANGQAELHELTYNFKATVENMQSCGLTQGYHASLETGYWPSEDVLPSDLRVSSCASG